jgi:hypothetical protein
MAGYNIYEILTTLVERVAWPNQTEKIVVLESIEEMQEVNLFGNMSLRIECRHERTHQESYRDNTTCVDCGRILS